MMRYANMLCDTVLLQKNPNEKNQLQSICIFSVNVATFSHWTYCLTQGYLSCYPVLSIAFVFLLCLQYVELKNKLARVNGYADYGDELRQKYETPTFESDIRNLYDEMKPLYLELHAYIRRKLYETYGPDIVDVNGKYLTCVLLIFVCLNSFHIKLYNFSLL